MSSAKKLMGTTAVGGALAIEDVFSTYLYTGDATARSITNGIDLAGEGGLVWSKSRSSGVGVGDNYHYLFDTERGSDKYIFSNATNAEVTSSLLLTSFNSDGYSIGTRNANNQSGETYASWTFRKAPRFFDVVTYTGTGSARTVSHNLGSVPGCIIIKCTTLGTTNWLVYHAGQGAGKFGYLNTTGAFLSNTSIWQNTTPTDTQFYLGTGDALNGSGQTYVAYLFAHDPLGPSGDGSDGLIACGSYTGNGSTNGPEINLGWEPQWVMIKRTDVGGAGYDWFMFDAMRGMPVGGADLYVDANSSDAETGSSERFQITPTGFKLATTSGSFNASGGTYIYIAIRRGPMRQPTSGTEVFAISTRDSTPPQHQAGFPVDMVLEKPTIATGDGTFNGARLIGERYLVTNTSAAEASNTISAFFDYDYMDGWRSGTSAASYFYSWMFRRAPGFFDVFAYTGQNSVQNLSHNLGTAPEMMWIKRRSSVRAWAVYHAGLSSPTTSLLYLNDASTGGTSPTAFNSTAPTDGIVSLGINSDTNVSGETYIAYLFATLPGVSKVGSYTGNGSSQTINCGFASGARFVLIKRTDSTGDWYVWDTARGIVAGIEPHLSLNTASSQVTSDDSVDPDSSGFIVNQVAATNINVNAASYIFYAIA